MNAPAFEVLPRDLTPYRAGNTGIDYVHRFESGKPGPHVLINGITHGNEFCGMVAVCHLLDSGVRPKIGTLTLSFANVAAYETLRPGAAVRQPADHAQPEPHLVGGAARRQRRQRRAAPSPRDAAGGRRCRPHPRHPLDQPRTSCRSGSTRRSSATPRWPTPCRSPERAPGDAARARLGNAADPVRRARPAQTARAAPWSSSAASTSSAPAPNWRPRLRSTSSATSSSSTARCRRLRSRRGASSCCARTSSSTRTSPSRGR